MTKLFISTVGLLSILVFLSPTPASAQSGDSVCYATLNMNHDSIPMSVADLIAFVRLLTDSTAQIPWFEADLTGDCVVDTADIRKVCDFFVYGISVFPQYPVPTCCNPDIKWVCCLFKRGNVNGDTADAVNIVDVTYLVSHLFQGGPPPFCREEGNVNGDPSGSINVVDVTFLVNRLFNGGQEPPNCFSGMPF
ncbi:MAG: hypothetical protein AAB305_03935 [Candidatus Zixiibacteriota bacterium]